MSFFLPDTPTPDKKSKAYTGPVDYFSGLPVQPRSSPPPQPKPQPQRFQSRHPPKRSKARPQRHNPQPNNPSMKDTYNGLKETYHMGKEMYNLFSGKNRYLSEPKDYNETLERAKQIKKMEREAMEYHKAQEEIRDFEQRKAEYEASQPKKGFLNRFRRNK